MKETGQNNFLRKLSWTVAYIGHVSWDAGHSGAAVLLPEVKTIGGLEPTLDKHSKGMTYYVH